MKTKFTLLIFILLSLSVSISAQTADQILPNVVQAMNEQHWEEASNLFRLAVDINIYKSESFFLKEVSGDCPARPEMLRLLGNYYKNSRNYDKAYDYYKELSKIKPLDITYLTSCAELELMLGKENDALNSYEKVLSLDENNLTANIFIGNYYYFSADKEKQALDKEYKKINSPTRMQYARYRNELSNLVANKFNKAKLYLEKVVSQFPSVEVKKTLNKIHAIEEESKR